MSIEETVTLNLELNVEQALSEIRRLETLLFRTLSLARRLGLPEDISEAVYKIERVIMSIRMLHTSMTALTTATGPVGWALAAVGLLAGAVNLGESALELG